MEREGYLKSVVSKADRRRRAIMLTAKGKSLLVRAYPYWKSAHEEFQRTHGAKFAESYRAMLREVTNVEDT
jgi:DNA-binding MarR family transcriptional regulator